jgi:hypothetical protein
MKIFIRAVPVCFIAIASAGAQGTLSTQGFGYPPGHYSTRALATGGGLGEFDPDSPLNPAAIATSSDPRVFLQYEPEWRKVTSGSTSSSGLTARFPVVSASVPLGSKGSIGISASTFLDRSSSTTFKHDEEIAGTLATITETTTSLGSINDLRLAIAFAPSQKIQLGVGGHAYTGQNRQAFVQSFPDTLNFSTVSQLNTIGFQGFAVSAGLLLRPSKNFGLALSGRKGGTIEAHSDEDSSTSKISSARVPDRYGAGITYEGIPGSSFSAHVSRDMWSRMNGLGSSDATAVDTWEGGFGIESLGPRILQRQSVLRIGARYRTLPFLAAGAEVKELSFAAGLGAQFFRNRAAFDIAFERAQRKADSSVDARERAYILSFGLRVRP